MTAPAYAEDALAASSRALTPYVQTGVERAVISRGDGRTWAPGLNKLSVP